MAVVSRSIRHYRERKGLEPTFRGPRPACAPALNPVHDLVLRPPWPEPYVLAALRPDTPDAGPSTIWPHGTDGETPP